MGDQDKTDVTDTDILYDHLTNTTSLVEAIALLEGEIEEIEKPEALATLEEIAKGATARHRRLPKNED